MIVYLQPKSAFSKSIPRSDTLFGAICWSISVLYGVKELEDLLECYIEEKAPFIISSMFPYIKRDGKSKDREQEQNGQNEQNRLINSEDQKKENSKENSNNKEDSKKRVIHLLPRPLLKPMLETDFCDKEKYERNKKEKKVKLVSKTVFDSIIDGTYNSKREEYDIKAGVLLTKEECKELSKFSAFWQEDERARNSINRVTNVTNLYHEPIVTACQKEDWKSGFYFLVKFGEGFKKKYYSVVKSALNFLEEKGFGGNSSVGFGQCSVEVEDRDLISNQVDGDRLVVLSLMHPSEKDYKHLDKNRFTTYIELEKRKGFLERSYIGGMESRVWKPTLFMLAEGSTFVCDNNREIYGKLYEEKKETYQNLGFSVRINGLAYTVAMKGVAG